MRIAVLILGLILGGVMVTQAVVVATLSDLVNDPLGADAGNVGLLMALLWLIAIAFVLGVPVVSILAFSAAAALGITTDVVVREQVTEVALWGALSAVLAVLSVGGLWEKLCADARETHTRAQIDVIAENMRRQDPDW